MQQRKKPKEKSKRERERERVAKHITNKLRELRVLATYYYYTCHNSFCSSSSIPRNSRRTRLTVITFKNSSAGGLV